MESFAIGGLALLAASCGGRANGDAGKSELLLLDQLGQPVAQTRALIDGQVVTTDDEGRAELGEMPASYDAVIAVGTNVSAFIGLRARSPTIQLTNRYLNASKEHYASVDISKANVAANQALFFAMGVVGADIDRQDLGDNSDEQLSWGDIHWAGAGDVTLSAQAFLADVDPITRDVVGYSGFASNTWSNAAERQSVDWMPEFTAPQFGTKTIHVDLSIPAGMSGWYSVELRQPSGEIGPIGSFDLSASADLLVPDLPGATFDVFAVLFGSEGSYQAVMRGVSAGATLRAEGGYGLHQLAPEDGIGNVTLETEFSWSARPGVVYELLAFSDSNTQPNYDYRVVTTASTARLPDTSKLGVPFAPGLPLRWLVWSDRGHASLDAYAAAPITNGGGDSDARTFTTAL